MFQLLLQGDEQSARNAQPVQLAQRRGQLADVGAARLAGLPDDGLEGVVQKVRVDLAHQHLHLQVLPAALHLHLLLDAGAQTVQHGVVALHHPHHFHRALRLDIGFQVSGVGLAHGLFQLGQRRHEPPVEVPDQDGKHHQTERDHAQDLEIKGEGRGQQCPGRHQDQHPPVGRMADRRGGIVLLAVEADAVRPGVKAGGAFQQRGGRLPGGHGRLVGGGDQRPVLGQDVDVGPQALCLVLVEVIEGLLLHRKDMDVGVAALEGRVDPPAAQHHHIPPGLAVGLGGEEVFLQRVKVEPAHLAGVVHGQLLELFHQQGGDLVGVAEIQHFPPGGHIDGVDLFLLDQAGIALEQSVVGVGDGVLLGDGVGAVVPVQKLDQPFIGGKRVRHAVHPIGKAVERGADVLRAVEQGFFFGGLLGPERPHEQQRDDRHHGHKAAQQGDEHPPPQRRAAGLHSAPPCTARYSAGLTP